MVYLLIWLLSTAGPRAHAILKGHMVYTLVDHHRKKCLKMEMSKVTKKPVENPF